MNTYRNYNVFAVGLLIIFAGFLGKILFWSGTQKVDATPAEGLVLQKTALSDDNYVSLTAPAVTDSVANKPSLTSVNDSLWQEDLAEQIFVVESDDSMPDQSDDMVSTDPMHTMFIAALSEPPADSSEATSSDSTSAASSSSTSSGGGTDGTTGDTPTDSTGSSGDGGQSTGGRVGSVLPDEMFEPKGISAIFLCSDEIRNGSRLLPLTTAMDNLLKYDAFWSVQEIAKTYPEAWRTLRSKYPDRLAMHYVTPFTVRPSGDEACLDYSYVENQHPEWFLLKDGKNASSEDYRDPSKRMRWNPDDPTDWRYNRFFLDVGNEDFQKWAVEEFIKKLCPVTGVNAKIRYSGIVADNVLLTVWHTLKTKLYPNWKYAASASEWDQVYFSYLKKLHDALIKQGYILIVNHTTDYSSNRDGKEWQDLMAVVDGMADEQVLGAPSAVWGGDMWEWSLKHHEEILQKGLYDWWIFIPDASDSKKEYQQFLYTYCSFLLIRAENFSLFGTVRRLDGAELMPWYEEYKLPLGNPTGLRYQQQGCWFRDYQHGRIVVNPSGVRCTIPLDSKTYTLDWRTKSQVTQVTLEPLTATILLPTGYSLE
ncbi:MAG: putative glycoside hydrolase [Planctomycetota bacterium]|nr:putative glycoside hydrolase [Planctomycetota bacterium]